MHIGLVGGIGPGAQDFYTRRLIALFAEAGVPLEMTTVHADTPTLLANQAADRRHEQAAIFAGLSDRLAKSGAEVVAITSIAGHFCRSEFAQQSALPVLDMIEAVARNVADRGYDRVGILGTRRVMESRFYDALPCATVISPLEPELGAVHSAYAAMAAVGSVSVEQQAAFDQAAGRLVDQNRVQAILLGGTDLALAFNQATSPYELIDCASIHADMIAHHALAVPA